MGWYSSKLSFFSYSCWESGSNAGAEKRVRGVAGGLRLESESSLLVRFELMLGLFRPLPLLLLLLLNRARRRGVLPVLSESAAENS